jgi:acyl carrier protein
MRADSTIVSKVIEILRDHVKSDVEIAPDTDMENDLSIDSLKSMEILASIEDAFDITIPINVLGEIRTVQDLAEQIGRQLSEQE